MIFFTGNADGLGKKRKEELTKSCRILGLSEANVILHKYFLFLQNVYIGFKSQPVLQTIFDLICSGPPHFEDNQKLIWDAKLVADTLVTYIQKFRINCVIIYLVITHSCNLMIHIVFCI